MNRHHQDELRLERKGIEKQELVRFLGEHGGHRLSVTFTCNRVSMISVRFAPDGSTKLRLHQAFLDAPSDVHTALRTYLHSRRRVAWQVVSLYARSIITDEHGARTRPRLPTVGRVFDLERMAKEVNHQFFNGRIRCRVGWGRRYSGRRSRRSRSIRYGSWDASTRTAKINPILDNQHVPEAFVRYIIFHEMLHAVVPHEMDSGHRQHHTRQFKVLEKTFPELDRMKQLSRELLDTLI